VTPKAVPKHAGPRDHQPNLSISIQFEVDGNVVAFADRQRLSFPQLSQITTYPHWSTTNFGNDIEGITHQQTPALANAPWWAAQGGWILSRTEFSSGRSAYGVVGFVGFQFDLFSVAPDRYEFKEPQVWQDHGFHHFGDIQYDPQTARLYISINDRDNTRAGIGILDASRAGWTANSSDVIDLGAVTFTEQLNTECAWAAYNGKNGVFYTTNGSAARVLHRHTLSFAQPGKPTESPLDDLPFINADSTLSPTSNIQGGKASSHGKLWIYAKPDEDPGHTALIGVDPYSGIVHVKIRITLGDSSEEAEGLDITEAPTGSPGIGGQIHVQDLQNRSLSNDAWNLLNFQASDLARL